MITGGKVTKVRAENVKDAKRENTQININILNVKAVKNALTIQYEYAIVYEPDVATMTIEGELYLEEKDSKSIQEAWEKSRRLPDDIASEVLGGITFTGSAVGTLLAFAINVPAPISVPRAQLAPAEQKPAA